MSEFLALVSVTANYFSGYQTLWLTARATSIHDADRYAHLLG